MIITKTPFRMSFFGGGTDMEPFFVEHGGAVLSTTFDNFAMLLFAIFLDFLTIQQRYRIQK